jgi:hypothetical protein
MSVFSRLFKKDDPNMRIVMINSVDDYVAGVTYDLPTAVADTFIVRGYAKGTLSRDYSTDELTAIYANPHRVDV